MKLDLNFKILNKDRPIDDQTAAQILANCMLVFPKSRCPLKMLSIARQLETNPVIEIDADDLQKLENEINQYELSTLIRGAFLEAIIKAKK